MMRSPEENSIRSILVAIFLIFVSWTRIIANIVKHRINIRYRFCFLVVWNILFLIASTCFIFLLCDRIGVYLTVYIGPLIGYFRINELVIAFYSDSIATKRMRIPTLKQRVFLLTMSYAEVILQFAIIHYSISILLSTSTDELAFHNIGDAIYFSAITITTTGYGDLSPKIFVSRIAAGYEAIVGIVFIAIALSTYLSALPKR